MDDLEDHFDFYNVPDYYKILIWGLCLTSVAKTWYRRWRADRLHAYSDFTCYKAQFLEILPLVLNKAQLAAQPFSRRQSPTDNCGVFALETIKLFYLWKTEVSETEVFGALMGQLRPYLQDFLYLRNPSTIQQCLIYLRKYNERHDSLPQSSDFRRYHERHNNVPQSSYFRRYDERHNVPHSVYVPAVKPPLQTHGRGFQALNPSRGS